MEHEAFLDDLRGMYGGGSPEQEERLQELAAIPGGMKAKVKAEGTRTAALTRVFGDHLEAMAEIQAACVEEILLHEGHPDIRRIVHDVMRRSPWERLIGGLDAVERSRLLTDLVDDVRLNLLDYLADDFGWTG